MILDNGLHIENGVLRYAWCLLQDNGRRYYRAAAFRELYVLTRDPQSEQSSEGLLGKQWGAVTGLYNAGVNFVYSACGIFTPHHIGIVQMYGAAASGDTLDSAAQRAEKDLAAVEATLAGYAQAKLRPPDLDVMRWYIEFLSKAGKPLVLLGHPDPRAHGRTLGRDGAMPEETDDLSLEQNEILFRGLARLRENFIFQLTAEHISRPTLTRYLDQAARLAGNFASRRKGAKSIGFSLGIPLFNALTRGYTESAGLGRSQAHGQADGYTQAWGEGYNQSRAHTETNGTAVSSGYADTISGSIAKGQAHTDSWAHSEGWAHTIGHSQSSGSSFSSSWSRSMGATLSQGGGLNIGGDGLLVGGSANSAVSQSQGLTWGESYGSFASEGDFDAVTHSEANTIGGADTSSTVKASGWAHTESHTVTSSHSESDSEGEGHTASQAWGKGHTDTQTEGVTRQSAGGAAAGAGITYGLAPALSFNQTWQTEDDLAERVTEIMRGFESLLNAATHSGAFAASVYLFTDNERGASAAAALVPQAFYGEGAPTPVLTVLPDADERERVRSAARAFYPLLEPSGDPNDPYDGWLFWKHATLLNASHVAAYTTPGMLQEGTLKVIAPIPNGMGFYPQMPGEVTLGHQISPFTADLTTAPVRLDRARLMHTLFAGDTGFGKSVAAMRMAYEMALHWGMRVVVLDFGFAWRSLLNAPGLDGRVDIRQLRPDGVRPLRWNPMQIGTYINPETQLKAFADVFGSVAQLGQKQQQHRLLDAARTVYLQMGVMVDDPEVRAHPQWGRVSEAESQLAGVPAGTPLGNLSPDQRQRIAVLRSKAVGLQDLYREIERQYDALPPRDQVGRGVLEGILWRLKSLVRGAPSAQFGPGADAMPVEDLGRPDGVVILEGGKFLDNFAKAWLLGWAGWLIYSDMVARRERQLNRGEADLFMIFEEANIIFSGLDGGDPEARTGPSVSEQYSNMFRDSRKYGCFFGVITQSPSLIPQGIISSCNNLVIGFLKNPEDKNIVLSAIARSEKGFVDEPWRRFLSDEHIGMVIGRFPYVYSREYQLPFLFRPLILNVPEPTDDEIAHKLGRITL